MKSKPIIALIITMLGLAAVFSPVQASRGLPSRGIPSRGIPGSGEFAYGGLLWLQGNDAAQAAAIAGEMQLDWIALQFDWSAFYPEVTSSPDWTLLDSIMNTAGQNGSAVLLSVTAAPHWALSATGPDAFITAGLIKMLVNRYPSQIQAVELFPGANTSAGWQAPPDPALYARMMSVVSSQLASDGRQILLVAAGLIPVDPALLNGDMADMDFLRGFYQAGGATVSPVISMRMPSPTGSPLEAPEPARPSLLRHFEEIRQIMLENNHQDGLIWITGINAPITLFEQQAQSAWLVESFTLMRSQLYIGAVFYASLNNGSGTPTNTSLISSVATGHLFYNELRILVSQNNGTEQNAAHADQVVEPIHRHGGCQRNR